MLTPEESSKPNILLTCRGAGAVGSFCVPGKYRVGGADLGRLPCAVRAGCWCFPRSRLLLRPTGAVLPGAYQTGAGVGCPSAVVLGRAGADRPGVDRPWAGPLRTGRFRSVPVGTSRYQSVPVGLLPVICPSGVDTIGRPWYSILAGSISKPVTGRSEYVRTGKEAVNLGAVLK